VLLFDDETRSVGERFAEAELLGIPATVVVGNGYREDGLVDVEGRDGTTVSVVPGDVPEAVADVVGGG
jgi:prolyl-tRNA synthetase